MWGADLPGLKLSFNHQDIVARGGSGNLTDFLGRFLFFTGRRGSLRVLGGLGEAGLICFSFIQFDSFGEATVIDFNILTQRAGRLS
jgi:hypothetical protein